MHKRDQLSSPKHVSFRVSSINNSMNLQMRELPKCTLETGKAKQQARSLESQLPNTSGRTFEHLHAECLVHKTSLDDVYSMWINSLRIPVESLECSASDLTSCTASNKNCIPQQPFEVLLLLHCNEQSSLPTAISLTMKISASCSKTYEFTGTEKVCIPISTLRPTLVSVKLQQESNVVLQNVLVNKHNHTTTKLESENFFVSDSAHIVYSRLSTENETHNLQFPCYMYQRDADKQQTDYDLQSLAADLTQLDNTPLIVPSSSITLVSRAEAQTQLAKLEKRRRELLNTLQDCRRSTAMSELGATAETASEVVQSVDWKHSYCVPSDTHIAQVIVLAREMHSILKNTCNMAVFGTWFFQPQLVDTLAKNVQEAVCDLLSTRTKITTQIAGRRRDLQSVVRVRTSFLVLSAIDDALRSVCGARTGDTNLFTADNISCHAYWLGQIKSHKTNSVTLNDECYDEACSVLALCSRVKKSSAVLLPACDLQLSNLSRSVWQNMHLQGLASADPLVVASAPHFLYKQQKIINYSKHPFLLSLHKHTQPTELQLQSTKLMAILTSADVEHRIITPGTQQTIESMWELACQKNSTEIENLCSVFDTSLHSLILTAMGESSVPDISFLTEASNRACITGYNDNILQEYNAAHLSKQLQTLEL